MAAEEDLDIRCRMCDKLLAKSDSVADNHNPTPEELFKGGAVPLPNFGGVCSQECGRRYTEETGVEFDRDAEGSIRYY